MELLFTIRTTKDEPPLTVRATKVELLSTVRTKRVKGNKFHRKGDEDKLYVDSVTKFQLLFAISVTTRTMSWRNTAGLLILFCHSRRKIEAIRASLKLMINEKLREALLPCPLTSCSSSVRRWGEQISPNHYNLSLRLPFILIV